MCGVAFGARLEASFPSFDEPEATDEPSPEEHQRPLEEPLHISAQHTPADPHLMLMKVPLNGSTEAAALKVVEQVARAVVADAEMLARLPPVRAAVLSLLGGAAAAVASVGAAVLSVEWAFSVGNKTGYPDETTIVTGPVPWSENTPNAPRPDVYPTTPNAPPSESSRVSSEELGLAPMCSKPSFESAPAASTPAELDTSSDPDSCEASSDADSAEDLEPDAALHTAPIAPAANTNANHTYSLAHVAGAPYVIDRHTPEVVKRFLSEALSNNQYRDEAHLEARALAYFKFREAEVALVAMVDAELTDPQSALSIQLSWMLHLTRGLWKLDPQLKLLDPQAVHTEIRKDTGLHRDQPVRRLDADRDVRNAYLMLLFGQEGPALPSQTRVGLEIAKSMQELYNTFPQLNNTAIEAFLHRHRHGAIRNEPLPNSSRGQNLDRDPSTQVADETGLPVMNGTSGSTSDFVLLAKYAAAKLGTTWFDPSLTEDQAMWAVVKAAHHFFRSAQSVVPHLLMNSLNEPRMALKIPEMKVEPQAVFTHSIAETYLAAAATVKGTDPKDREQVIGDMRELAADLGRRLSEGGISMESVDPAR